MIQLRDYQLELVEKLRNAFKQRYRCPLVVLPTGGGKTVFFSYVTHGSVDRENPVFVVAHRRELITQISLSLAREGVMHNIIAPPSAIRDIKIKHFKAFGKSYVDPLAIAYVGSVQTVVRRFDSIPVKPKLIIMDEAHHVVDGTMWGEVMKQYPDALGLKVTATPERLDKKGLGVGHGGFSDVMIEGPSMSWLIEHGYLSPYRCFTTRKPIDLAGIRTVMGDWDRKELEERIDKPSIIGDAVEHYISAARGLKAIVYCVSIATSKKTAEAFRAAGISAAHLDGDTDDEERAKIIADYADGKIDVLCNQALFTEGFDLASVAQKPVTIDCVIDLAPTKSVSLYLQKVGRALRPAPGKVAVILDHAGNVLTHGLPDAYREWSLEGRKKRSGGGGGGSGPEILTRTCPECLAIHKPEPVCPVCSFEYPIQERKVEQKDGTLVELSDDDKEAMKREAMKRQGQAQSVEALMRTLGYSRGRAEKILEARSWKDQKAKDIAADIDRYTSITGLTGSQSFGVSSKALNKMKPKELRTFHSTVIDSISGLESIMADRSVGFDQLLKLERERGFFEGWAMSAWRSRDSAAA